MALLDSKAQYFARAKEIGLSAQCMSSLQSHAIETLGALAFSVGTTPGECSPQDFQQFVLDKQIQLEGSDEFLLKRLIFEAQTLFMTSIQNQVLTAGLPAGADSNAKKLPPVERQARIVEQKQRLVGVIIQGESEPSFELIDLAYSMIESKSIKFIPPHRCTKRDTELLENTSKDKEILTIEQGRLTTKKSSLPNASTSDALKLSNCFVRRALALDLAQVSTFTQINKYHHSCFLLNFQSKRLLVILQPLSNRSCKPTSSFGPNLRKKLALTCHLRQWTHLFKKSWSVPSFHFTFFHVRKFLLLSLQSRTTMPQLDRVKDLIVLDMTVMGPTKVSRAKARAKAKPRRHQCQCLFLCVA